MYKKLLMNILEVFSHCLHWVESGSVKHFSKDEFQIKTSDGKTCQ